MDVVSTMPTSGVCEYLPPIHASSLLNFLTLSSKWIYDKHFVVPVYE